MPDFPIIVVKGVICMEEMIGALRRIGLPDDEVRRIREQYRDDLDGLAAYVLYMKALFGDQHEYA